MFGNPFDPWDSVRFSFHGNNRSPTVTEVDYGPTTGSPGAFDCVAIGLCTQVENGGLYSVAEIDHSDGTIDTITFRWIVTPEPTSALLLTTVMALVAVAR
jgi:hypothetical protein